MADTFSVGLLLLLSWNRAFGRPPMEAKRGWSPLRIPSLDLPFPANSIPIPIITRSSAFFFFQDKPSPPNTRNDEEGDNGFFRIPFVYNLLLLLSSVPCFNCTFFVSLDTPLRFLPDRRTLSPVNLHLLQYQIVPLHLPFDTLAALPVTSRLPSALNGSFTVVTSLHVRDGPAVISQMCINDQLLLAPDVFVSDDMVVHAIAGFLAPFAFGAPFPPFDVVVPHG